MEILVCMKQVPDDSVEIHLGADGQPDLSQADPQGIVRFFCDTHIRALLFRMCFFDYTIHSAEFQRKRCALASLL